MTRMLHEQYEVATIEGQVEVTPLLSILHADSGPSPVLVAGGSLCFSLTNELKPETKFGSSRFPSFSGHAKLTGHCFDTRWDTFPLALFDINSYTFVDDDTKVEVNVNRPLIDKIEMDLFYNDGNGKT